MLSTRPTHRSPRVIYLISWEKSMQTRKWVKKAEGSSPWNIFPWLKQNLGDGKNYILHKYTKTKYLSKHGIWARNPNLFLSDIWLSLEWHMFSTNAGKSIVIKILQKRFNCYFILSQKAERRCDLFLMTLKNTHKLGFQELKETTIRSSKINIWLSLGFFFF